MLTAIDVASVEGLWPQARTDTGIEYAMHAGQMNLWLRHAWRARTKCMGRKRGGFANEPVPEKQQRRCLQAGERSTLFQGSKIGYIWERKLLTLLGRCHYLRVLINAL